MTPKERASTDLLIAAALGSVAIYLESGVLVPFAIEMLIIAIGRFDWSDF